MAISVSDCQIRKFARKKIKELSTQSVMEVLTIIINSYLFCFSSNKIIFNLFILALQRLIFKEISVTF